MTRRLILILEDNDQRIKAFAEVTSGLNAIELKVWRDAATMIGDIDEFLPSAALISLDHDLNDSPNADHDPGTGLDVAEQIAKRSPVCPVILHSSNYERVWSMHNALRYGGWKIEHVGPLGTNWIQTSWLSKVRALTEQQDMKVSSLIANGRAVEAKLPCSLEEFLVAQGLLPRSVVVEHNGEAVAPSEFSRRQLHAGDRLEIVKIVAGG